MLLVERKSFTLKAHELKVLGMLGLLFAASSITYYQSFRFMDAGIASTILFVYPVMVAVLMAIFFKEHISLSTSESILLALVGIGLLYKGDTGASLNINGIILVMTSSLTYAVYIVVVNKSRIQMSPLKVTFYVMLTCMLALVAFSFTSPDLHLQLPHSSKTWFYACWLGLVPTVISLVLMTISVHEVGATTTAIMGALEPLTAVAIGALVFGEAITPRLMIGIMLILVAVMIIIVGKNFHLRTITHAISVKRRKHLH